MAERGFPRSPDRERPPTRRGAATTLAQTAVGD